MTRQPKNILAELPSPEVIDVPALAASLAEGTTDLVVVLGPTASGKTKYAVRLAGELASCLQDRGVSPADPSRKRAPSLFGSQCRLGATPGPSEDQCRIEAPAAEIISADSRQVFRGMDIGTGKDLSEYGDVPYHLIDILPAGEQYNVHRFQEDFSRAWQDILSRGRIPILCGGTGLYINSVLNGYDFCNRRPLSELRGPSGDCPGTPDLSLPRNAFVIGTLVSREVRNARIDARLDARLAEGMVDEIRSLLDGTSPGCTNGPVPAGVLLSYGLEYKFVTQYLLGEIDFGQMRTLLATAIHQFAKRQMTWFRGMERSGIRIHWTEV